MIAWVGEIIYARQLDMCGLLENHTSVLATLQHSGIPYPTFDGTEDSVHLMLQALKQPAADHVHRQANDEKSCEPRSCALHLDMEIVQHVPPGCLRWGSPDAFL